jgi:hypothetical protein
MAEEGGFCSHLFQGPSAYIQGPFADVLQAAMASKGCWKVSVKEQMLPVYHPKGRETDLDYKYTKSHLITLD